MACGRLPDMRMGIVGTSWWADLVHGPAAAAAPDWELTTVYGRSPAKAEKLAAKLRCAWTSDEDELLESVDGLAFSVPPEVQARLARKAAGLGKHLLLEKPLALDVDDARVTAETIAVSGVASLVFFTALWNPSTRSWLDGQREQIGWESGRYEHITALPPGFLDASPWRAEHGALWDIGPHMSSVLEWVLGPITEVSALAGARDLVELQLRHASGATSSAVLTLQAAAGSNRVDYWFGGTAGEARPDEAVRAVDPVAASVAAMTELARQATTGERGGIDASYGEHVVRVLEAARASLETGRRVAVS